MLKNYVLSLLDEVFLFLRRGFELVWFYSISYNSDRKVVFRRLRDFSV